MASNPQRDKLIEILSKEIKKSRAVVAHFSKTVASDDIAEISEAFYKSESVVQAVATWSVFEKVLRALTDEDSKATCFSLEKFSSDTVNRQAEYMERSSSMIINVLQRHKLAAWSKCRQHIEDSKVE